MQFSVWWRGSLRFVLLLVTCKTVKARRELTGGASSDAQVSKERERVTSLTIICVYFWASSKLLMCVEEVISFSWLPVVEILIWFDQLINAGDPNKCRGSWSYPTCAHLDGTIRAHNLSTIRPVHSPGVVYSKHVAVKSGHTSRGLPPGPPALGDKNSPTESDEVFYI